VVVVFAVLFWVASMAGLAGLPLAFILLSWTFKYAYILFDHVVLGVDEPPTLDISMMNPVNEQRPLAQLFILALTGTLVFLVYRVSPVAAWVLGSLAVLAVPASVAILGLEGNPFKAVYPVALARMIAGLGTLYWGFLAVIGVVALAVYLIGAVRLWPPLEYAVVLFAILSLFSGLAGALYERRLELGLETAHSPERTAAKARVAALELGQQRVTEAYGQVRLGAHAKAWAELTAWLESRGHAAEDYRWLRERVSAWPDPRYAHRLTQELVDRLLMDQRPGEALDEVRARLRVDPDFRPATAAATLRLAELAARGGGAVAVARTLLNDFPERFPDAKLAESARALARELAN
jgi:hypothetical protein